MVFGLRQSYTKRQTFYNKAHDSTVDDLTNVYNDQQNFKDQFRLIYGKSLAEDLSNLRVRDVVAANDNPDESKEAPPRTRVSQLIYPAPFAILPTKILLFNEQGEKIGERIIDDRTGSSELSKENVFFDEITDLNLTTLSKIDFDTLKKTPFLTWLLVAIFGAMLAIAAMFIGSTFLGIVGVLILLFGVLTGFLAPNLYG